MSTLEGVVKLNFVYLMEDDDLLEVVWALRLRATRLLMLLMSGHCSTRTD